nr:MAG TPA: hypothetical protein [Caudoviricetes sp.]
MAALIVPHITKSQSFQISERGSDTYTKPRRPNGSFSS